MKKLFISIALFLLSFWAANAGSEATGGIVLWFIMISLFSGVGSALLFTFYIDEK